MSSERGGIVTGWLFKLIISIALFGVVAFEAGAIVVGKVTIEDIAADAAEEAADAFARNRDDAEAARVARDIAEQKGATLEVFDVVEDGKAVTVTVAKRANTLFLHRIGPTKDWTVSRATRRRGTG